MIKSTISKTLLGAEYDKDNHCVNFRLFSKNATAVLLCIFDKPQGEDAILTLKMQKDGDIWKTSVKDYVLNVQNRPIFYGFRVFGANWEYDEKFELGSDIGFKAIVDENSNRFNPNKIAYDPYSKELSHTAGEVNSALNMFHSGGKYYLLDNAKWAIKSVFYLDDEVEIVPVEKRAFKDEIIGEVHLKDLTQNLSMAEKGTYLGAAKFAKTIKRLGISMIEFLPLNEFDSKQNGTNHWGYMPLDYFSLARKYAYDKTYGNSIKEFRKMINELHENDIKVCLDMVYNHTGEAGLIKHNVEDATQLSYSLIDNSSYYKTYKNGYYRSNSGCGNDFNIQNPAVMDLIVDSLTYWANQGVDAFRFDLAAALLECSTNCDEVYDSVNSFAAQLKDRLEKNNVKVVDDFNQAQDGIILIAEPWTCGGKNCYQLGNFPYFWAEWNDVCRDTIRKSTIRENEVTPFMLKDLIEGTYSRFKNPDKAVNYIASHDGFTLYDLNSFDHKSLSTSGGSDWEICSSYDNDQSKRENAIKKQLALLFLSSGVPMIQIGDIILHTKNGNNNSYNKDDNTNYLNWYKATNKNTFENRIMEYTRNLIKFRNAHDIFTSPEFKNSLTYYYNNGEIADIDNRGYWDNVLDLFFGFTINLQNNRRIFVATVKSNKEYGFSLPKNNEGLAWYKCLDTSDYHNIDFEMKDYIEKMYVLNPHALAIFMER